MREKDFHWSNGDPWSNEFLSYKMYLAVDEENYERAAKCNDEINRRLALERKNRELYYANYQLS